MANARRRAPVQNDMVRELNRQIVLQVLSGCGSTSRTRVAQETGLSVPTVNTIVNEFVAKGVLEDVGAGPSAGGRPAQLVRLDPRSRLVLALDLNGPRLRAAVVDLHGEALHAATGPVPGPGFEDDLAGFIDTVLTDLPEPQRVGRLAFAVPGVVDPVTGHVRLAPTLAWDDYPLADSIERSFGVSVTLENDVNALTLAELHYGLGREHRYLVCVAIGDGIGAGLVVDGRLYRGATAAAGEIGYSLSAGSTPTGPLQLGSPGPLERHLLERSRAFVGSDGAVDLTTTAARSAFDAFAADFGVVIHNLACLVNPELLTISWPADAQGLLAARLREGWCGPLPLTIRASELGPNAALRGVARLAVDELERELCASGAPTGPTVGPAFATRASATAESTMGMTPPLTGGAPDESHETNGSLPAGAVRRSKG